MGERFSLPWLTSAITARNACDQRVVVLERAHSATTGVHGSLTVSRTGLVQRSQTATHSCRSEPTRAACLSGCPAAIPGNKKMSIGCIVKESASVRASKPGGFMTHMNPDRCGLRC